MMTNYESALNSRFPFSSDCNVLSKQIELLIIEEDFLRKKLDKKNSDIAHKYLIAKKKWFEVYGCEINLSNEKAKIVGDIITNYSDIDAVRIKEQTNKNINQRIIAGVVFLTIAMAIIIKK